MSQSTKTFSPAARAAALLLVILSAAAIIRLPRLASPFIHPHEAENAIYGLAAKNFVRFGLGETRGANCLAVGTDAIRQNDFYINHPPFISMILGCGYAVLGVSEATTRIVAILFSLIGIAAIFLVGARHANMRIAVLASMLAAFYPIAAYFGRIVTHVTFILPFAILLLDSLSVEKEGLPPCRPHAVMELLFAALVSALDYGGTLLILLIPFFYGFRRRPLSVAAVGLSVGTLNLLHVVHVAGWAGLAGLFGKGLERAGIGAGPSWLEFTRTQINFITMNGFTILGTVVALAGLALSKSMPAPLKRIALLLLAWGILYIVIFKEAASIHDYWQYYLIAPFALYSANALSRMRWWLGGILLAAIMVHSIFTLNARYYSDIGWYDHEFKAIAYAREHATGNEAVFCKEPIRTAHPAFYSDRRFNHAPSLQSDFALSPSYPGTLVP